MRYKVTESKVIDSESGDSLVCECPSVELANNVCRHMNNGDSTDKVIAEHEKQKSTREVDWYMCYAAGKPLPADSDEWGHYNEVLSYNHKEAAISFSEDQADWFGYSYWIYVKVHKDGEPDKPQIVKIRIEENHEAFLA